MADNTLQKNNENIATDELSTLNGTDVSGASPRIKAQRVKPGFGSDGVFRDVDTSNPLPVTEGGRVNASSTLIAAGAKTATPTPAQQTNDYGRGLLLFVNITATPNNAETLKVAMEAVDPVTGTAVYKLAEFDAIVASALGAAPAAGSREHVYVLYPGAAEESGVVRGGVVSGPLPRTYQVRVTHSAGGSWNYSVGAVEIL